MGRWLAAFAVLISTTVVSPVRAEDFPWCTELDVFTRSCMFSTYEECTAVAASIAKSVGPVKCVRNANYQPPVKPAPGKSSGKPR